MNRLLVLFPVLVVSVTSVRAGDAFLIIRNKGTNANLVTVTHRDNGLGAHGNFETNWLDTGGPGTAPMRADAGAELFWRVGNGLVTFSGGSSFTVVKDNVYDVLLTGTGTTLYVRTLEPFRYHIAKGFTFGALSLISAYVIKRLVGRIRP